MIREQVSTLIKTFPVVDGQAEMPFDRADRRIRRPSDETQSAIVALRKAGATVEPSYSGRYRVGRSELTAREVKRLARTVGWQP